MKDHKAMWKQYYDWVYTFSKPSKRFKILVKQPNKKQEVIYKKNIFCDSYDINVDKGVWFIIVEFPIEYIQLEAFLVWKIEKLYKINFVRCSIEQKEAFFVNKKGVTYRQAQTIKKYIKDFFGDYFKTEKIEVGYKS